MSGADAGIVRSRSYPSVRPFLTAQTVKEPIPLAKPLFRMIQNGKYGFIDRTGAIVIPPQFDELVWGFVGDRAQYKSNDQYGFIDQTGKPIIPAKYRLAFAFSDGLALVVVGTKYGYIDKAGTVIIPPKFEEAQAFKEGLAAVKIGENWGYIDKTGTVVIPPKFDYAMAFAAGLAPVLVDLTD